jgi:site-specific recombinase XerD
MLRRLLERQTDHATAIAQLRSPVTEKEMGQILDRYLALKGHAAAPGGIGAHPLRGLGRAALASHLLQPGSDHRVVGVEVPADGSALPAG